MRVIIAGGGIVGLTAGIAFKAIGWDVLVCEQAPEIRAAGAAIGLWRNALDVFSEVGVGDAIHEFGMPIETWFYDAAGARFRAPGFELADHEFLLVPRPELNRLLAAAVGLENIRVDTRVAAFEERADHVAVSLSDGTLEHADLLLGADGAYSAVRAQLVPGYAAREHIGHHVWRGMLAAGDEPAEGSVLTVGHRRTRGGYTRTYGDQVVWMVNQFDSATPVGTKKEEALLRAANLNDNGWSDPLVKLIERTPEAQILHNPIMFVPALPRWTSARVALIGDAAHALSPHISAGGTLGVEDVRVLIQALRKHDALAAALPAYESNRMPHYARVHELAYAVELAQDAREYAREYARFSHWMLNDDYQASRA
ncbi:FAD-dependent oxidoreductase [Paraburkholderia bryophila]|uniref:2-polyprenyl-6-methoxyphenol hydroxylase-like FAD-dependent oxidoreductase n=1 Tax=Paraburkholderia bryophila TaxID=420952 RepID=A0A329CJS2_9BURK|nr:FAD-dependent monooxygenase [Paraburkholderia bryophila]RAS34560.1 2-polyprenyl-6-methoxyphenol hydroxylase-like FAD-dependent oxidoreductase [Paraburkholderia bryophila]